MLVWPPIRRIELQKTVTGITSLSEKDLKLKEIWEKCIELDITAPREVVENFGGVFPEVAANEADLTGNAGVTPIAFGFEIDLTQLPENTKTIRVQVPRGSSPEMARWDLEEFVKTTDWQPLSDLYPGNGAGYSKTTFYKEARETEGFQVSNTPSGLMIRRTPEVAQLTWEFKDLSSEDEIQCWVKAFVTDYASNAKRLAQDGILEVFSEYIWRNHPNNPSPPDIPKAGEGIMLSPLFMSNHASELVALDEYTHTPVLLVKMIEHEQIRHTSWEGVKSYNLPAQQ